MEINTEASESAFAVCCLSGYYILKWCSIAKEEMLISFGMIF